MERRRRRRSATVPPFDRWLSEVTPLYTWDWLYLQLIQEHLDKVTIGKIKRLMLFMPPRHGKSAMVTIRYPVWRMINDPSLTVITAAYNQLLADKFSRQARRIAERCGLLAKSERTAAYDWETDRGGGMRAVGVGGGITGSGAKLILIDDPVKSREEAESEAYRERVWNWYRDDLYTRLEPGGAIIEIQTRWHEDDLAGRILASEDGPNWTVVSLPAEAEDNDPLGRAPGVALCPARYDLAALAEIRQVLGSQSYYALYQQRPQPPKGATFQRDWFPRRNAIARHTANLVVQAWDTAFKEGQEADRSACLTIALQGNTICVLDAWKGAIAYPELIRRMKGKALEWRPDALLIEDKGSGISAVQTLRTETGLPIIAVPAHGSKVERANLITATCEAGRVVIPETPWGEDLLDELQRFPTGKFDDQVDAFTYCLTRIINLANGISSARY